MLESTSALSAIFTVVAILYGLWYSEIDRSSKTELPRHEEDRKPIQDEIRCVRNSKGIPLLVVNLTMGVIFLPDVVSTVHAGISTFLAGGSYEYDSLVAAFLFIMLLSAILDATLISDIRRMSRKLK